MTSMPAWDSSISGFSHCFIVVSSSGQIIECRVREFSGADIFRSRSFHLPELIHAAFHLLLERLARCGGHPGRERANFFGLGRERPQ